MMYRPEQDNTSGTPWPWHSMPDSCLPSRAAERGLLAEAVVGAPAGLLVLLLSGRVLPAALVWSVAGILLLIGLVLPSIHRRFRKRLSEFGGCVGALTAWLVLVPFFYLCFPLGRVLLLLVRRDPLDRRFSRSLSTYWAACRTSDSRDRYRRQF